MQPASKLGPAGSMAVAELVIVICVLVAGIIGTTIAAMCLLGRINGNQFAAVAVVFIFTLPVVYWITHGIATATDAVLAILDAGNTAADTLRTLDCPVPPRIIDDANTYPFDFHDAINSVEESIELSIWGLFGSFVGSVVLTAVLYKLCGTCKGRGSAVFSICLSALAGTFIAAGLSLVCSEIIAIDNLSTDLRYLVDSSAPNVVSRLLPPSDIAALTAVCSNTTLGPILRFTRPGAFESNYDTLSTGVCTSAFGGSVLVVMIAWLCLVAIIVLAKLYSSDERTLKHQKLLEG